MTLLGPFLGLGRPLAEQPPLNRSSAAIQPVAPTADGAATGADDSESAAGRRDAGTPADAPAVRISFGAGDSANGSSSPATQDHPEVAETPAGAPDTTYGAARGYDGAIDALRGRGPAVGDLLDRVA